MKINEVTASSKLPTITFSKGELFHIGKMDKSLKRNDSLEGAGISVSTQPDAWRGIAHLQGDVFSVHKNGNKFINAHLLSTQQVTQIQNWAIEDNLIEPSTIYRYTFTDEDGEEMYTDSVSKDELINDWEPSEDEITVIDSGIKPTDKLKQLSMNANLDATDVISYVIPLYAEYINYDGVWWDDVLDVHAYSAPRGVITPSKINEWEFRKIK